MLAAFADIPRIKRYCYNRVRKTLLFLVLVEIAIMSQYSRVREY